MTLLEFMASNPSKGILILLYHLFLFIQLVGTVCECHARNAMLRASIKPEQDVLIGPSFEGTRERGKMLMHSSRSTDLPLDFPWFPVWDLNFVTCIDSKTSQYFLPEVLWLFTLSWWAVKPRCERPYHNETAASPWQNWMQWNNSYKEMI